MEHRPWIGPEYLKQSADEKLFIAGYSHWQSAGDEAVDSPDFTLEVFRRWVFKGELRFFNTISQYFGESPDTFWNRVAFANTLPTLVGTENDRYDAGTSEQRAAVPDRALRLIAELKPARIFVFSTKAWRLWPDYSGALKDGTLQVDGIGEVDCGTYRHADGEAIAFGLRHPQYARIEDMRAIVTAALSFQP